ncbi:hypothetical protein A2U01_0065440 [Trifolium medium]|uniref:Uncharacterized protein n=1 Tax=Trifolium medium TaxID=97028 RepID=A0A392S5N4_9FABA|nr:hypothetical protein [Trifolium medium]
MATLSPPLAWRLSRTSPVDFKILAWQQHAEQGALWRFKL